MLGVELDRLQIEPHKLKKIKTIDNPFSSTAQNKHSLMKQKILQPSKCSCLSEKNKGVGISKNKPNNIIKEPILKILKKCGSRNIVLQKEQAGGPVLSKNAFSVVQGNGHFIDSLNLCTLVQNCNQLKISSETKDHKEYPVHRTDESKWWISEVAPVRDNKESVHNIRSSTGTCSQQALIPPCDITIDELASYFETLVHIPKKMSTMAEMMYI